MKKEKKKQRNYRIDPRLDAVILILRAISRASHAWQRTILALMSSSLQENFRFHGVRARTSLNAIEPSKTRRISRSVVDPWTTERITTQRWLEILEELLELFPTLTPTDWYQPQRTNAKGDDISASGCLVNYYKKYRTHLGWARITNTSSKKATNQPTTCTEVKKSANYVKNYIKKFDSSFSAEERQDARKEPPPSTITFQEYIAAAKELQLHQRILLHLADRRLRNYLRAAPTPPPSPKRNAPALTPSVAQPADPSGSTPPVWRLIRLDTPPPPQKPRLDPRLRPTDPRRYRAPLNGAQTPPLPEEIEREQRRKATHHQLALFIAKHPQPARSAPKKSPPTKLSLLRKPQYLED
ncbi:unnamed protein product [Trichogramma brassicae]|uniref:Uncharacterized protein n=1 Tax=Trichogramma brassicae TaxID=86971 RepID=A0A6H5IQL2_9HYME|nr:unnamed protein product [Trichogramma brassicae]